MFGDDVNTKQKPVKGYRFLIFTFLMIIALTTVVAYSLEDIKKEELDLIDEAQKKITHPTEPTKQPTDDQSKTQPDDKPTGDTKTSTNATSSADVPKTDEKTAEPTGE